MKATGSSDFHLYKSNEWVMYLFIAVYIALFLLILALTIANWLEKRQER